MSVPYRLHSNGIRARPGCFRGHELAQACPVVFDQSVTTRASCVIRTNAIIADRSLAQTFTVGTAGLLTSIDVGLYPNGM